EDELGCVGRAGRDVDDVVTLKSWIGIEDEHVCNLLRGRVEADVNIASVGARDEPPVAALARAHRGAEEAREQSSHVLTHRDNSQRTPAWCRSRIQGRG